MSCEGETQAPSTEYSNKISHWMHHLCENEKEVAHGKCYPFGVAAVSMPQTQLTGTLQLPCLSAAESHPQYVARV